MSMRLRVVDGKMIAICAARSVPKEGDIYLDDAHHSALDKKFARDTEEMYGIQLPYWDADVDVVEQEESNNPNREWWDATYPEVQTNRLASSRTMLDKCPTEALKNVQTQ